VAARTRKRASDRRSSANSSRGPLSIAIQPRGVSEHLRDMMRRRTPAATAGEVATRVAAGRVYNQWKRPSYKNLSC
jgi:hypothetical protein